MSVTTILISVAVGLAIALVIYLATRNGDEDQPEVRATVRTIPIHRHACIRCPNTYFCGEKACNNKQYGLCEDCGKALNNANLSRRG